LDVEWILDHPESYIVKEIRGFKKGKVEKEYVVRWHCSNIEMYNVYGPNQHNTSIETEFYLKRVGIGMSDYLF
jgi:hypothetical protein